MAILKRPMFRKGGSTNEGIMHGLERRGYADSNWKDIAAAYGHGRVPLQMLEILLII